MKKNNLTRFIAFIMLCTTTLQATELKAKSFEKAEKARLKEIEKKRKSAGNFDIDPIHTAEFGELGMAIYEYENEKLKSLLAAGANISTKQGEYTPLGIAILINNVEAVKLILSSENFSDINTRYSVTIRSENTIIEPHSPIMDAIEIGNPEVLKLIIDKNPNINDKTYETISIQEGKKIMDSQTIPLLAAAFKMFHESKKGKGYNDFDPEAQLTQILRLVDKTTDINRIIIQNSAHCAPGNIPYKTPGIPNFANKYSLLMYLTSNYTDQSPINDYYNQLVKAVIDKGVNKDYSFKIVNNEMRKILRAQNLPEAQIKAASETVIRNVDCRFSAEILAYMLDKGWSIANNNDNGAEFFTYLYHVPSIKMLVSRGININTQNKIGQTILHNAVGAFRTHPQMLEEILKLNPDQNIKDKLNMTPIDHAKKFPNRDQKKIEKLFAEYGK